MLCVMKTIVLFEDLVRTMARPLALLGVGGQPLTNVADAGLTTRAPGGHF